MNKQKLIEAIASEVELSKAATARVVDAFTAAVTEALAKGDSVTLIGFGTFVVGQRKQRTGRNPQTGKTISIPAARVPRFRPGKKIKEAVNKKK